MLYAPRGPPEASSVEFRFCRESAAWNGIPVHSLPSLDMIYLIILLSKGKGGVKQLKKKRDCPPSFICGPSSRRPIPTFQLN